MKKILFVFTIFAFFGCNDSTKTLNQMGEVVPNSGNLDVDSVGLFSTSQAELSLYFNDSDVCYEDLIKISGEMGNMLVSMKNKGDCTVEKNYSVNRHEFQIIISDGENQSIFHDGNINVNIDEDGLTLSGQSQSDKYGQTSYNGNTPILIDCFYPDQEGDFTMDNDRSSCLLVKSEIK